MSWHIAFTLHVNETIYCNMNEKKLMLQKYFLIVVY